jgi:hypothetical protein
MTKDEMLDRLPKVAEVNRRLVANAREKRMLVQMKKLAEQRQRLEEVREKRADHE